MTSSPNPKPTIAAQKSHLRAQMRHWRRTTAAQTPDFFPTRSAIIVQNLAQWLHNEAKPNQTLAIYLATPHEPNLDALIPIANALNLQVVAPREGSCDFYLLRADVELDDNTRIREPREFVGGRAFEASEIDIFLLPGLAFDKRGGRLGHGGGWYDRALQLAPNAVRIGVCFEMQVIEKVPRESHDEGLNWIVCESGMVRCERA